jgi:hypothetical protein
LGQKKHPKCYILVDLFTNSSGHPGINYGWFGDYTRITYTLIPTYK